MSVILLHADLFSVQQCKVGDGPGDEANSSLGKYQSVPDDGKAKVQLHKVIHVMHIGYLTSDPV